MSIVFRLEALSRAHTSAKANNRMAQQTSMKISNTQCYNGNPKWMQFGQSIPETDWLINPKDQSQNLMRSSHNSSP